MPTRLAIYAGDDILAEPGLLIDFAAKGRAAGAGGGDGAAATSAGSGGLGGSGGGRGAGGPGGLGADVYLGNGYNCFIRSGSERGVSGRVGLNRAAR